MAPEQSLWIRLLFRIGARYASETELGDVVEEYAGGKRSALWSARQVLSTFTARRRHVVLGPGCLCFALALSYRLHPALRDVARSYRIVLGAVAAALEVEGLAVRGMADLALGDRKVSGNAQLRGRHGLLHQGTLLNGFEPALLPRLLSKPRRQPLYRAWRRHLDFVGDVPLPRRALKSRLLRVCTAVSDEAVASASCAMSSARA